MASSCNPSCLESAKHYPFIVKIFVEDGANGTNLYYQFVKECKCNYQCDTSYIAKNVTGPPILPNYDDSIEQCSDMTTHASRQRELNLELIDNEMNPNHTRIINQNFINIEYHEAVYPLRVCLYKISNQRTLIRIWAKNSDNQWFLLWDINTDDIHIDLDRSNLWSPPIEQCNFKTKMLRLEFHNSLLDEHCTKLNAVMLIGTSDMIFSKNPKKGDRYLQNIIPRYCNIPDLTPDRIVEPQDQDCLQKKFREYCVITKSHIIKSCHKDELGHKQVFQSIEDIELLSESKELPRYDFSTFPTEIILKVFKYLDVKTLCNVSTGNRRLREISQDPFLYKDLNIRNVHFNYCRYGLHCKLRYFAPKCMFLSQLDLSYCDFYTSKFLKFLEFCGSTLKQLKLTDCSSIDDFVLFQISKICIILKELDVTKCPVNEGISFLKELKLLERLHIDVTGTEILCNVLQENRHMRDLKLSYSYYLNVDAVVIELKNSCPNLERINLSMALFTSEGFDALADCKNLQEMNFAGARFREMKADSFPKLFSSCQRLEGINLSCSNGLTDRDLKALTLCKNLKRLQLSYLCSVTPDICTKIFKECPKLEKINLEYCTNITTSLIDQWENIYKNIIIYS